MLRIIEVNGLTYIVNKYHYEEKDGKQVRVIDKVSPTVETAKKVTEEIMMQKAKND